MIKVGDRVRDLEYPGPIQGTVTHVQPGPIPGSPNGYAIVLWDTGYEFAHGLEHLEVVP